jgi:hypothetical protein
MCVGMFSYDVQVLNNEATVPDHLEVFSECVHRSRRQLTCA